MLAVCAAIAANSSAKPANLTCRPAGSRTVANDGRSRIYSVPFPTERPSGSISGPALLYGCMFATRHPVLLGTTEQNSRRPGKPNGGAIDPKLVSLHAPWVAYPSSYSIEYANQLWVTLRDLRTGNVKLIHPAEPELAAIYKTNAVTDVAVGANGSFAWISVAEGFGTEAGAEAREVAAVDSSGNYTELDTATDIARRSLTLSGQQLSWFDNGSTHSALLP
jgi:hypothetical protein